MSFNIEYIIRAVDQFSGVARNISMSLAGISANAEYVQKKFHHLERQFKVSSRVMMESFTLPILAISGFALKASMDMENLDSTIINAAGSSKYLASITSELHSLANKGIGSMAELTTAATSLLHAGIKGGAVSGLMGQIGDISAGSHQKIADVAEFVAKIKEQGHLSAGDLTDLTKFGLEQPLLKMFHTVSGAPVQIDNLRKALAAGTISWGTFQDSIRQVTNATGIYFGQSEEQWNTLGGSVIALKEQFMQSISPIGDEISKQFNLIPRLHQLQAAVNNFSVTFKDFVKANPELTKFLANLGGILASVGPMLFGFALFSGVLMVTAGAVRFVLFPLRLLFGSIVGISRAIKMLTVSMDFLAMSPVISALLLVTAAVAALVYVIVNYKEEVKELLALYEKFKQEKPTFQGAVHNAVSGYQDIKKNGLMSDASARALISSSKQPLISTLLGMGKNDSKNNLLVKPQINTASQSEITVNIKGNTDIVKSVETKSKGNAKFNVGTNMLGAF